MVIDTIGSLIINAVTNGIENKRQSYIESKKIAEFRAELEHWMEEFCDKYDGSIITKGDFTKYIDNYKPIERTFEYVITVGGAKRLESEWVNDLLVQYKSLMLSDEKISSLDERIFREFFMSILSRYKKFLEENMRKEDKLIVHLINQESQSGNAEIKGQILSVRDKLDEVAELLRKKDSLEELTKEKIYFSLIRILWNGNIDEVITVLEVIDTGEKNLIDALKFNVQLLTEGYEFTGEDIEKLGEIESENVKYDVIRRIISINIKNNVVLTELVKYVAEDTQLYKIIEDLQKSDYQRILQEIVTEINSVKQIQFKKERYYDKEEWLVNRIILEYILGWECNGIYQELENLIEDPNIIEKIIIWKRKSEELMNKYHYGVIDTLLIKNLLDEMCANIEKCKSIKMKYRKMYLLSLLKCSSALNENYEEIMNLIPKELIQDIDIQVIKYENQIINKLVDENDLLSFCRKNENYRLIYGYAITVLVEPLKIIDFLDDNRFMLSKSLDLLLLYSECQRNTTTNFSKDKMMLFKYQQFYRNSLEFMIEEYMITNEESILKSIFQKRKDKVLQIEKQISFEIIIELYLKCEMYDEGIYFLNEVEALNMKSSRLYKMKAAILLGMGKANEALQILIDIVDDHKEDTFVLANILMVAVVNRRVIPIKVIEYAKRSECAEVLLWLALDYRRNNDIENSQLYITKSLLRCCNDNLDIYAKYILISTEAGDGSGRQIKHIEEETAVCLNEEETGKELIYCIHKKNILPRAYYMWEESIHIEKLEVIRLGLLRKKKGDMVKIDNTNYTIKEILSLECFLFRLCMNKMVQDGGAKKFQFKIIDGKLINIDEFVEVLESTDAKRGVDWLQNYTDMINTPASLFLLYKKTNLTYEQFISYILKEKNIQVRNVFCDNSVQDKGYVLSCSAMLLLYHLGVPTTLLNKNNVIIPASLLRFTKDEFTDIFNKNNRDTVATLGVKDKQLFLNESIESEKVYWIEEASKIEDYANQLRCEESYGELESRELKIDVIKEVFGACDYDAMVLANERQVQIVGFEPMLLSMSTVKEITIGGVDILKFLINIKCAVDDLIGYLKRIVEFRMVNIIHLNLIEYIVTVYTQESNENRQAILRQWITFLNMIDTTENEYKENFVNNVGLLLRDKMVTEDIIYNDIVAVLMKYILDAKGLSIEISYNYKKGTIEGRVIEK